MTITNLGETTPDQLRKLLEDNGIPIVKTVNDRFIIKCPECDKNEAYVYFNRKNRVLTCNRENNCANEVSLWDYIADKQGINANDGLKMLEHINQTLGLEFNRANMEHYNALREEQDKEQEFFRKCHQIFSNALRNEDDPKVAFSLAYLKNRGYTTEQIKAFNLGFFPDHNILLNALVINYGDEEKVAHDMMRNYFDAILAVNGIANSENSEEKAQRITFTCYDTDGKIVGFIVRKPAAGAAKGKYLYNTGMKKGEYFFNLNTLDFKDRFKKSLVIVEGQLDALAATHMSSQNVKNAYHFVASGGSLISDKQAQLLKNQQFSQVTFFIDNDKAGDNFSESVAKLRKHDITAFVASIPEIYPKDVKDVDQLLREHPDVDLYTILENKKPAIEAELDIIKKKYSDSQNIIKSDKRDLMIREYKTKFHCVLLNSELSYYKEYMKSNFNIDESVLNPQAPKLELSKGNASSGNKNEEHPLIATLRAEIAQFIAKNPDEPQPLDMHEYRRKVHGIQKALLEENIARDIKNDKDLKASNNILAGIQKYNDLLNVNYEEDKPYTSERLLEKVLNNPEGLRTGFLVLDEYVTIQPSSLVFIAGKPSHGKTTMMLNMLRNMIKNYPDKSFLFYSYEETVEQIWLKILLSNIELNGDFKTRNGRSHLDEIICQIKTYKMSSIKTEEGQRPEIFDEALWKSYEEVKDWIKEGRLQLLDRKPSTEVLTSAIIERVKASIELGKPTGGIFIDYVQKLTTEVQKPNRQQELQVICETLLLNSIDKRVNAAIILGAQVNREVKSLDTLTLSNIREAADIEHVANLVLGVWDDRAAKLDHLRSVIETIENKIIIKKAEGLEDEVEKYQENIKKIKREIKNVEDEKDATKQIKILKNRNGKKDNTIDLECESNRFLLKDYC